MKFAIDPKIEKKFPKIITDDPHSLAFQLRCIIRQAVKEVLGEMGEKIPFSVIFVEHPINKGYGDYSSNIAMIMAGRLKMKPRELAEKLKRKIDEYIGQDQTIAIKADSYVPSDLYISPKSILENVKVEGCGFLNLVVATTCLISQMERVLEMKEPVITAQMTDRKIAVEYTDPNPFKEFHLGHMYSNFIGEAIARLFEACGATVWRGDFYGDVGMHIAKSVYGLLAILRTKNLELRTLHGKEYIEELKKYIKDLGKLPISERQKLLGEGYALGTIKFDEDKQVAEEVKDINYLIYIVAQEILKKDKGWQPIIDYRQYVRGREDRLEEVREVYGAGLKWSLEYFETIYKRLGTKFDGYYPESWVGEYGMKLVEKGLKMGVLEKSEGGVIYRGEQDGLHTRVFVNKLGLPTYEAKDLGLAMAKYQDFKYDLSINVFGKEIDEYYKVVKAAMKKIEPEFGEKAYHIAHGMVRLPEGKMSSRSGNVITFEWLLDEAKKRVLEIIEKTDRKAENVTNSAETAEKVAIGAVRYALLKNNIGNDIVFDFGKSVSFEGDSGPYLMYTYARCMSVLRKAHTLDSEPRTQNQELRTKKEKQKSSQFSVLSSQLNLEEISLLRLFYRFPEVVAEAAATFSPHLLCAYLFEMAQTYSLFYQKHTILESDFRLVLTQTTANLIKRGLFILGIETVEKM